MKLACGRRGFHKPGGSCSFLNAELWGICLDLQLAWNLGARQVVIEVDSLLAVDLVSRCSAHVNNNFSLVDGIKHLMARDWIVKFSVPGSKWVC